MNAIQRNLNRFTHGGKVRGIKMTRGRGRRRQKGRGLMSFLGKAGNFLQKNQVVSKLANSGLLGKYSGLAGLGGSILGMGRRRRRRRCGRGLRLAGH